MLKFITDKVLDHSPWQFPAYQRQGRRSMVSSWY